MAILSVEQGALPSKSSPDPLPERSLVGDPIRIRAGLQVTIVQEPDEGQPSQPRFGGGWQGQTRSWRKIA